MLSLMMVTNQSWGKKQNWMIISESGQQYMQSDMWYDGEWEKKLVC